jgi:hypothetical protein
MIQLRTATSKDDTSVQCAVIHSNLLQVISNKIKYFTHSRLMIFARFFTLISFAGIPFKPGIVINAFDFASLETQNQTALSLLLPGFLIHQDPYVYH